MNNSFCIFGVSETWLSPDYPSRFVNIPGYNLIRADRCARGGGVACYVKVKYKYTTLINSVSNSVEQLWLKIRLGGQTVVVGVIYRIPSASPVHFFDELYETIERVSLESNSLILMGDININLLNTDLRDARRFQQLLDTFDTRQVINSPTRVTVTSESLIDVMCVSNNIIVKDFGTLDLSDITN